MAAERGDVSTQVVGCRVRMLPYAPLLAALCVACAHTPEAPKPDPLGARQAAEAFHRSTRWRDFRGASAGVVPDRREQFVAACERRRDERDLEISDYELLDLRLDPSGDRAAVVSHVSWLRLPSLTERTDTVTTELVRQGGAWLVARQDRGPFAGELGAPYPR